MADVNFYEGDLDENSDAGEDGSLGVGSDGYDSDSSNPDAGLSPLQQLEKYMNSEHSYSRQVVARGLFETLVSLEDSPEETEKVFQAMSKLSSDPDSSVRAEIGEQIIRMTIYLEKKPGLYPKVLSHYLLPILTTYLKDLSIPVRKTSENTILSLVKENQVTGEEFESKVAPVILEMSEPESNDDFRTEAVLLMTKFAPMLGCDVTKRVFLTRFMEMCSDALFHVRKTPLSCVCEKGSVDGTEQLCMQELLRISTQLPFREVLNPQTNRYKVCASNFGEVCRVVGREVTETFLLPKFFCLCEDGVWGVRNACAECFMQVANVCSPEVRRDELSVPFVNLLCDQSRWVRMAAFQALGGFISTFANPELTGLSLTEDGQLLTHEFSENQSKESAQKSSTDDNEVFVADRASTSVASHENISPSTEETGGAEPNRNSKNPAVAHSDNLHSCNGSTAYDSDGIRCPGSTEGRESSNLKISKAADTSKEIDFDTFHYWRTPMITVEDFDMASDGRLVACSFRDPVSEVVSGNHTMFSPVDASGRTAGNRSTSNDELVASSVEQVIAESSDTSVGAQETLDSLGNEASDDVKCRLLGVTSTEVTSVTSYGSESCFSGYNETVSNSESLYKQTIVPAELLRHYLSMVDSSRAQTVDSEIMRHCAFSFPAVAYTLGRENWPCLKELYETLARDMQWKVRRTLAFSIHELALILGAKLTGTDLLPIFDEFLKDLDEVRIGALKHLAEFLKLLSPDVRRKYLIKFPSFLDTDNTRNWRFRMDLAQQLLLILDLFSPTDIQEHLGSVALTLAEDRVALVRMEALKVLTGIARRLCLDVLGHLWSDFISEMNRRFAHSDNWSRRQSFVYFCDGLLETGAISENRFVEDFLPTLVQLGADSVPNVRITVARVLKNHIANSEFFARQNLPQLNDLVEHLKSDKDKDVRLAIDPQLETTTTTDETHKDDANAMLSLETIE